MRGLPSFFSSSTPLFLCSLVYILTIAFRKPCTSCHSDNSFFPVYYKPQALRCLLPNRSLSLFREVLAEFLEFHQEAGIFWEAMDEAYTSIIDVFRDN